jgi:hypothetical protein
MSLKNEGQEGKTSLVQGLVPVGAGQGGGMGVRVKEGKHGRITMYSCMKMEQ